MKIKKSLDNEIKNKIDEIDKNKFKSPEKV